MELTEKQIKEWYELTGGEWYESCRARIDAQYAKRNVVQPAPAESVISLLDVRYEVIDKMVLEFDKGGSAFPSTSHSRMTAAANVLLDALRGPVTEEEGRQLANNGPWPEALTKFLESRIARILKPKEKTFKEQVKAIISRATNSFPADVDKMSEEIAVLAEKNGGAK